MDVQDDKTVLDIPTASAVLGISAETLRKRLQRGRLEGFKAADGTWRVVLDAADFRRSVGEDGHHRSGTGLADDRLERLHAALEAIAGQLDDITDRLDRVERKLERLPSLMALLELKADEPSVAEEIRPLLEQWTPGAQPAQSSDDFASALRPVVEEQMRPIMLALLDVLQSLRGSQN